MDTSQPTPTQRTVKKLSNGKNLTFLKDSPLTNKTKKSGSTSRIRRIFRRPKMNWVSSLTTIVEEEEPHQTTAATPKIVINEEEGERTRIPAPYESENQNPS